MYIQHLLNKHIEKQFLAFRRGFLKVVDTDLIRVNLSECRCFGQNNLKQLFVEMKSLTSKSFNNRQTMKDTHKIHLLSSKIESIIDIYGMC